MKIRMFEKSIVGLIVGAVLLSLVISWWISKNGINKEDYSSQVVNLAGVRG